MTPARPERPAPSRWYGGASLLASFVGTVVLGVGLVSDADWLLVTVPATGMVLLLVPALRRVGTGLAAATTSLVWLPVWLGLLR